MKKDTIGYAAIVAMLIVTGFFSVHLFFQEKTSHDKLNISLFPRQIGDWTGEDIKLTEKEYSILETRNLILRKYVNPAGDKLLLFIIYSETNRSVFHPPEVCLIGSGVEIADKKVEEVKGDKYAFMTNKLYLKKENSRELILYCYKAGKLYMDNYYFQQAYLALHQIFGRRIPGATIRVSMPMNGSEEAVLPTLKKFLKDSADILDKLS